LYISKAQQHSFNRWKIQNMAEDHNFYNLQYADFASQLNKEIRAEAFGEDIGQNSWITAEEQDQFIEWLELDKSKSLLDIACGSGGPTLRIAAKTGCQILGVDIHEDGIRSANDQASVLQLSNQVSFEQLDGSRSLPFQDNSYDGIICIDAINHFPDRQNVFKEWHRVLKPGAKLLFTDPITVTGILTKDDFNVRASIGYFLFVAKGVNELLLKDANFNLIRKTDCTDNMANMARRWKNARAKREEDLLRVEGKEAFERQQTFLTVAAELGEKKDLSRYAFLAKKI